jgi:hypothetical protein
MPEGQTSVGQRETFVGMQSFLKFFVRSPSTLESQVNTLDQFLSGSRGSRANGKSVPVLGAEVFHHRASFRLVSGLV